MNTVAEQTSTFYVVGGTMPPDAPSYVERPTDRELYERVLKGELCYVLTTRQVGKSSLLVRAAKRLRDNDVRVAMVELTVVGSQTTNGAADKWYFSVAEAITDSLELEIDLEGWWEENERLSVSQRLVRLLRDVVLTRTHGPVAVFFDEIDSTLSLPFTDDFFAALRACYNLRATEPEFKQLTFVLTGVASPSDLIMDPSRTPFNVGTSLELRDFTAEESKILARGLGVDSGKAEDALARIFYWTDGHPYLTQKICDLARDQLSTGGPEEIIDRLVEQHFLSSGVERNEPNLRFVRDRLAHHPETARQVLKRFKKVRSSAGGLTGNPQSPIDTELKLTGLVKTRTDGRLEIRNRIYQQVFNKKWMKKVKPTDVKGLLALLVTVLLVLLIASSVSWFMVLYPRQLVQTLEEASRDKAVAISSYRSLRGILFYGERADELFAEFCERQTAHVREDREARYDGRRPVTGYDEIEGLMLWRLEALVAHPTEARWKAVVELLDPRLLRTFRSAYSPAPDDARGESIRRLLSEETMRQPVSGAALSPQGDKVVTGNRQGIAQLWDSRTGEPLGDPIKHSAAIQVVAFGPDGKQVLIGDSDGVARLWDVESSETVGSPIPHGGAVLSAAFSPDGKHLVTGSADGSATLWRVQTGEPLARMQHQNQVLSAVFSPDGKKILTGTGSVRIGKNKFETPGEGTVQLWSTDGRRLETLGWRCSGYCSAIFAPDGQEILITDLELWVLVDVSTGQPVAAAPHFSPNFAAAFGPDGQQVLTSDLTLALAWNARTLEPTHPPLRHESLVTTVAFGPEGHLALTGTRDGTARLWDLTADPTTSASVLETSPEELRTAWQQRLNLRINSVGELIPAIPSS